MDSNLILLASAMRFKDSQEQATYLRHAASQGNCELVFAGLDVLGSTPWKINKDIFDVVLQVWNSGERLGKMPPAEYDVLEPKMEDLVGDGGAADIKTKSVYGQRMKGWLQGKANNHSDRCSVNYKIEIARAVSS
jgi:DNA-directed RNA polymerase, mitochondrial